MSPSSTLKITKVLMSFNDPAGGGELQYMIEALSNDGFTEVEVPFDPGVFTPENFQMRLLTANGSDSGPISYEVLKYIYDKNKGYLTEDDPAISKFEDLKKSNRFLDELEDFFKFDKYRDKKFASLVYCDVTERDMFGYEPVKSIALNDPGCGIWTWMGLRKFEFTVSNIEVNENTTDFKQRGCLYWNILDTTPLETLLFESKLVYNEESHIYTVYCNTNEMGRIIGEKTDSPHPTLTGRFELHFTQNQFKEVWGFPVKVCVHNTISARSKLKKESIVSIDFGTSSTCAAFQAAGNKELLRLSGDLKNLERGIKAYENPTNLMIYDWDSFFSQWTNENEDLPLLRSTLFDEDGDVIDRFADFDSGYTVEKMYSEVDDVKGHRKMEAILTRLKTIPMNIENGNDMTFVPYNDIQGLPRKVVAQPELEDSNQLDPVRFYGYLLGRIINNPSRGGYYTKYYISYPVKYERKIRDLILTSLADGIQRSLPSPVRETLDVSMPYPESVACLGAIIPEQLKLREGENPQAFAIFDLGGGTLDTSYGIYRNANDSDEEAEYYQTIQLLGIGGDPYAGGENLIHQLVFKIYADNQDIMQKHKIPFPLPPGVKMPADMDETLVRKRADKIMQTNLRTMMEKIGRPLFQYDGKIIDGQMMDIFPNEKYPNFAKSSNEIVLKLRDKNNEDQELTLKIDGIDEFLQKTIEGLVLFFRAEMERYFSEKREYLEECGLLDPEDESFELDEVAIFLGGNASKQKNVRDLMEKNFQGSSINIIGESEAEKNHNPSERTTVKTAVAFGQLDLGQFGLDRRALEFEASASGDDIPPFPFSIIYKDMGAGGWKTVLNPGDNSRDWKRGNIVGKDGKVSLFYTTDPNKSESKLKPIDTLLLTEDPKKRTIYVRVYDRAANTLEYRFGGKNSCEYGPDEPSDERYTIKLKDE